MPILPPDDNGGGGGAVSSPQGPTRPVGNRFNLFYRPSVYATRVDQLPVDNVRSAGWINTLSAAATAARGSATLWRNFSQNNTGYQPIVVDGTTATYRTVRIRTSSDPKSRTLPNGTVQTMYVTGRPDRYDTGTNRPGQVGFPIGTGNWQNSNSAFYDDGNGAPDCPVELSGGYPHPDSHVVIYSNTTGEIWEMYQYDWNGGDPTAYLAKYYTAVDAFYSWDGNTADESGQIIYPMLPKYSEIQAGLVTHPYRFNAPTSAVSQGSTWPARNGFGGGVPAKLAQYPNIYADTYPPAGAWFRLKDSYDISGFRSDTQVFLTALKNYGCILSDIGEAMSMVGTSNEAWPSAMLAELRTVPLTAIEFIDQGVMSTVDLKAFGQW